MFKVGDLVMAAGDYPTNWLEDRFAAVDKRTASIVRNQVDVWSTVFTVTAVSTSGTQVTIESASNTAAGQQQTQIRQCTGGLASVTASASLFEPAKEGMRRREKIWQRNVSQRVW